MEGTNADNSRLQEFYEEFHSSSGIGGQEKILI
jgi:hypothetical protein